MNMRNVPHRRRPLMFKALALGAMATLVSFSQVTGQPATPLPLVGFAAQQTPDGASVQIAAFRRGMEELGYVEGQNIRYEFRYANANQDLRGAVGAEIVALAPDIIVTTPAMGAHAADATSTIPIVVANMAVQTLLDELVARPQTNITGTKPLPGGPGIAEQVALALELVPVAANVGFLYDPSAQNATAQRAAAEAAASAFGITIVFGLVQSVDTLGTGAQALVEQGVNVIIYGDGGFMSSGLNQMLEVARTARIPVIYYSVNNALRGGLVVLGNNNDLTFHAAAALVDQIFKGANPAEVPFAEIDAAWLAVNLPAAAEIGFTFPPAVLERANHVIN